MLSLGGGLQAAFSFLQLQLAFPKFVLKAVQRFFEAGQSLFGPGEFKSGGVAITFGVFDVLLPFGYRVLQFCQLQSEDLQLICTAMHSLSGFVNTVTQLPEPVQQFFAISGECPCAAFTFLQSAEVISHGIFRFAAGTHLPMDAAAGINKAIVGGSNVQAERAEQVFALSDFVFEAMEFIPETAEFAFPRQQCRFIADSASEESAVGFD
jgi:hypothetical protein